MSYLSTAITLKNQPSSSWIRTPVVLFDVEGTLVDAVPRTLQCWKETLVEFGHEVSHETLQRLSGMDGRDMLAHLFPGLAYDAAREIQKTQGERYRLQHLPQVRPFPRVGDLFAALRNAGKSIGLATDCSRDELDHYLDLTGVRDFIAASACGDEAKRGKPNPDLLRLVLKKLGARPRDAVMIGDTPFDVLAARNIDAPAVGLRTGGFQDADFLKVGAKAVLPDIGALIEKFRPLSRPPRDRRAS
jgi:phosphoglycolate phosphatase-like HAD superfamily hydrolase